MYHWRVLPEPATPLPGELADVERAVAYWGGGPEVRSRIEALQGSSATVALFLEYIPQNLHDWMGGQLEAGDEAAGRACAMVERELEAGTSFMNTRGLLHFDAHFENILTDGRRLFFTDYGLAVSSRFELSRDEAGFFDRHRTYDRCYTVTYLVQWLVTALYGYGRDERDAWVRACAGGEPLGNPGPGRGTHRPACAARRGDGGVLPHGAEGEQTDPVPAGGDPPGGRREVRRVPRLTALGADSTEAAFCPSPGGTGPPPGTPGASRPFVPTSPHSNGAH